MSRTRPAAWRWTRRWPLSWRTSCWPGLDLTPEWFWSTVADLHARFAPRAAELLARRDELQAQLDAWHREHGAPGEDELDGYVAFLEEIGYLLPSEEPRIAVSGVDREIAEVPGPQLVVPATVPRYALNAANARWGSLFDALYGTDALPLDHELARGLRRAPRGAGDRRGGPAARCVLPARRRRARRRHRLPRGGRPVVADDRVGNRRPGRPGAVRRVPRRPGRARGGPAAPARAARGADRRRGAAGGPAAPRARRGPAAGVGGHHDRRPGGLRRHRGRSGQGRRRTAAGSG